MKKKINTIDLFAGCGGLLDGFEKQGSFTTLACVEWEKIACDNIVSRLKNKWKHKDAANKVIHFDIQRTEELFRGFKDEKFGSHEGLDDLLKTKRVNIIIGGPPCQAYSMAGRVRDNNGMKDDYRNYLFESYLKIVERYQPNFFIFENVAGILSAAPDGSPIINKIQDSFEKSGYAILSNPKDALLDLSEFGIPQNRKRVIILGINKRIYHTKTSLILEDFYNNILPHLKQTKITVDKAIGNLPKLYPLDTELKIEGRKFSHTPNTDKNVFNHIPRFHNKRDIDIFRKLADDIASEKNQYINTDAIKKLYTELTGKESNIHKYYVLRNNRQSNTIPAHLYKDGLRHIHPDPQQARSITVREAARLQSFDDDYIFLGSMSDQYKMIGNAVPPHFSFILATAMKQLIDTYGL